MNAAPKRVYRCILHQIVDNHAFITRLDDHAELGPPNPVEKGVMRLCSITSPIVEHDESARRIETLNSIYVYEDAPSCMN